MSEYLNSWEFKEFHILQMWTKEEDLETIAAEMVVALEDPRIQELKYLLEKYYNIVSIYNFHYFFVEENIIDDFLLPGNEQVKQCKEKILVL